MRQQNALCHVTVKHESTNSCLEPVAKQGHLKHLFNKCYTKASPYQQIFNIMFVKHHFFMRLLLALDYVEPYAI